MNFNNGIPFNHFLSNYFSSTHHDKVMHLSIFVDDNNAYNGELKNRYFNAALNHNAKLFKDPHFMMLDLIYFYLEEIRMQIMTERVFLVMMEKILQLL